MPCLNRLPWLNTALNCIVTFALVAFAWIFFRAANVNNAMMMINKLGSLLSEFTHVLKGGHLVLVKYIAGINLYSIIKAALLIIFLCTVESAHRHKSLTALLQNKPRLVRWGVYYSLIFAIMYIGVFEDRQFIYFQF